MSPGPGCRQSLILAAVEKYGAVYVRDLLPDDASKSEIAALGRAARQLAATGRVELSYYMCGTKKLLAHRPGMRFAKRLAHARHRPLSVGEDAGVDGAYA